MKLFIYLFIASAFISCSNSSAEKDQAQAKTISLETSVTSPTESLIVFSDTAQEQVFTRQTLPQLQSYAQKKGLSLTLRSPATGLPAEITSTPTLIYQTPQGRHIFAGRYTMMSSIQNFIRGSRLYRPSPTLDCRKNTWVWEVGRMKIIAVPKITALQGTPAKDFQNHSFQQQSRQWIKQQSQLFKTLEEICLQKTDRIFYFDFHPYRDKAGTCFLSLELYSPFSCIEPIFKTTTPLSLPDDNWEALFAKAIQQLEATLKQQLKSSTIGDAIHPVTKTIDLKSWEELGFPLPIATKEEVQVMKIEQFPEQWQFSEAVDGDTPLVRFNFMAPLNRYVGEVKEMKGQLSVDEQGKVAGFFEVNTQSLTMGSTSFDEKLHKKYLKAFKYPQASFRFTGQIDQPDFETGRAIPLNVEGVFQLMKYQHPMRVNAQLLPFIDEQGQLRLLAEARFQLRISRDYQLEGPDGPAPANETMLFNLNFVMEPIRG